MFSSTPVSLTVANPVLNQNIALTMATLNAGNACMSSTLFIDTATSNLVP